MNLSVFLELSHGIILYVWITCIVVVLFSFNYFSFNFIFTLFRLREELSDSTKNHSLDQNSLNVSFATFYQIVNSHIHLNRLLDCFYIVGYLSVLFK